jgi:hypothetical protein
MVGRSGLCCAPFAGEATDAFTPRAYEARRCGPAHGFAGQRNVVVIDEIEVPLGWDRVLPVTAVTNSNAHP